MKVFLASEFRCVIIDGEYYLPPKAYNIYKRYYDFFGEIVLCSRFVTRDSNHYNYKKAFFIKEIINIASLKKVILGKYDNQMKKSIKECDIVVVRVPSIIAYRASKCAISMNKKYLAEAMGDAWDAYWNHGLLGKIIAPYMHLCMKKTMKECDYSIYVTKNYLQKKYPSNCISLSASNVLISDLNESILKNRLNKIQNMNMKNISLLTTADVSVVAKGHKYVIKAISMLKKMNITTNYYLAGPGNKNRLLKIAKKCKVENNVHFLGELTMNEVFTIIDKCDIYVQPSLQEGLPRAVIEAMSRGAVCLGSRTAGTPELLDEKYIFKRKSAKDISKHIMNVLNDDLTKIAYTNFNKSREFLECELSKKRKEFFEKILNNIDKG